MKHTPGPWHYRPQKHDDWGMVRASPTEEDRREGYGGWIVANARSGLQDNEEELNEHRRNNTDPYEANARLIAAAPDLLKALHGAMSEIEYAWLMTQPGPKKSRALAKLQAARAAIAKATETK